MKFQKHRRGFTLIEIIISIAILSIIFIAFSGVFTNGFSTIMNSGKRTKAVEESQRIMDIIQHSTSTLPHPIEQASIETIINNITSSYDITLDSFDNNVTPVSGSVDVIMCRITIKVSYDNNTKAVYLTSLID